MNGKLYLIPSFIGVDQHELVFPPYNVDIIAGLRYFIVEELKTARRFIKKVCPSRSVDEIVFFELNEHTPSISINEYIQPCLGGDSIGMLSEAGVPCVADPGAEIVRLAHLHNIEVIPLVGPSSILLALMASGLNGQSFAFVGYLPVSKHERQKTIRQLEQRSMIENQTQCFMEAPYRNMQLLDDIIQAAHPDTMLCIAWDLTLPSQNIITRSVAEWKKNKPDIHKHPAIFLIKRE
ncbi:MAG: SAM-dependent methyltransferase [Bacteroidales bacterium]|nr:SAM-dependent methyltransferase [Bacteroidales bacterium]